MPGVDFDATNAAVPSITLRIWLNGEERIVEILGPDAVALVHLIVAGACGFSEFDVPPWTRPLSERVTALRERFDLDIQDLRVMRGSHTVPEFALVTPVKIISISEDSSWTG